MTISLLRLLAIAVILTLLLSLGVLSRIFRQLQPALQWFGAFLIANFLTEFISFVLARLAVPNWFLLHLYVPLKLIFLGSFFLPLLQSEKFDYRKFGTMALAFLAVLSILNSIFLQPLSAFNSNAYTMTTVVVIVCCVAGFFRLTGIGKFSDDLYPWFLRRILPALFIYESATLFIFMFGNYLQEMEMAVQRHLWVANAALNLIFHLTVFFSLRRIWIGKAAEK